MNFGKLFKKMGKIYPDYTKLSANHFSDLSYKELKSICKCLYAHGWLLCNYTHMSVNEMAKAAYKAVSNY